MKELTTDNFGTQVLQQKGVAVVDFYTDWCQPCKQLAPVLEELDKDMTNVSFFKINAEKATEQAAQYGVRSVPTLVILKDGEVKDTIMDMHPKEELQKQIETLIA